MDFLPIQPSSTNKINASINLANDGGSKSNTGYMNQRGGEPQEGIEESVDEVTLSSSSSNETQSENNIEVEFKKVLNKIKIFFGKIRDFVIKLFGGNPVNIENIYQDIDTENLDV